MIVPNLCTACTLNEERKAAATFSFGEIEGSIKVEQMTKWLICAQITRLIADTVHTSEFFKYKTASLVTLKLTKIKYFLVYQS